MNQLLIYLELLLNIQLLVYIDLPQEGEEVYLHSAGSYFHSWEDLVSDSLFYDRKQWRVNNRGGSGWFSREYILTFEDERVISQETRRLPFK